MSPLEARRLGQKNGREVVRKHFREIKEAGDLRAQVQEAKELEAYGPGRESYYGHLAEQMGSDLFGDYERGLNDGIRKELRSSAAPARRHGGRGRSKALARRSESEWPAEGDLNPWALGGIAVVGAVIMIVLMSQPKPQAL